MGKAVKYAAPGGQACGSETIVLGSQQYTAEGGKGKAGIFRDSIKHEFRSPNYTTRWGEIPEAE